MIVKELFGTQIINASFLFANSNISVKYYSKDFPSVFKNPKNHKNLKKNLKNHNCHKNSCFYHSQIKKFQQRNFYWRKIIRNYKKFKKTRCRSRKGNFFKNDPTYKRKISHN